MTNALNPADAVDVIHIDREWAADLAHRVYGQRIADIIRAGEADHHHFVQTFARHRLQAFPTPEPVAAPDAKQPCYVCGISNPSHNVRTGPFNENHHEYQLTLSAPNADLAGLVKRLRSLATGLPRNFQVQVVTEIADALEALSWKGG